MCQVCLLRCTFIVDREKCVTECTLLDIYIIKNISSSQLNNIVQTGHHCTKVVLNIVTGVNSLYEISFRRCTLLTHLVLDPKILHKLKNSRSRMPGTCIIIANGVNSFYEES